MACTAFPAPKRQGITLSIPKRLHFTLPESASEADFPCIAEARRLHPNWEVIVWQDPVEADGLLLSHLYGRPTTGAGVADLVRIDVVHAFGGVYLDSDYLCARPLDDLLNSAGFVGTEDGRYATNAVFGAPAGAAYLRQLVDDLLANEPNWALPPNVTTGPHFWTRMLRWNSTIDVLSRETLYPYNWNDERRALPPGCFGEHLWAGSWKLAHEVNAGRLDKVRRAPTVKLFRIGLQHMAIKATARGRTFARRVLRRVLAPVFAFCSISSGSAESASRPSTFSPTTEQIVFTLRGRAILVPAGDLSIGPWLHRDGTYEEPEQRMIDRVVKSGDWVVDVGSNFGVHSMTALDRVGPFGRVFAIDANGEMLELVQRSAAMNWLHDRLRVLNFAVSSDSGRLVNLTRASGFAGSGSIDPEAYGSNAILAESLPTDVSQATTASLDGLFPVGVIRLVKVDVEGHEAGVLSGARGLIKERRVNYFMLEVLAEVAPQGFARTLEQLEFAVQHGYSLRGLLPDGTCGGEITIAHLRRHGRPSDSSRTIVLARNLTGAPLD